MMLRSKPLAKVVTECRHLKKIIKLEQEFDNRKVELKEQREHHLKVLEEKMRAKRDELDKTLKTEVEAIRKRNWGGSRRDA